MEAAYPISMIETSKFKDTYSSMQSTGEVRRVEQPLEESAHSSSKTFISDTTSRKSTNQYTVAFKLGSDFQKSLTKKVIVSAIIVTNISPALESKTHNIVIETLHHMTDLVGNVTEELNQNSEETNQSKVMDENELAVHNEEAIEEVFKMMREEIERPVISFEKRISLLGYILSALFLILSLPFFIGQAAMVGTIGSLGLPMYTKIRQWERGVLK